MAKEPEKPEETEATAAPAGETAAAEETVMDAMMSGPKDGAGYNIDAMMNVGLNVQIVLGKTRMPISQLLKLSRGSIIELDKKIGEPVDIVINDRLVARGDLVKLDEDRIGVSLIEIVKDYVSEK
ncbi:MAG: flagellar motor switch protein FliN [Pseudomonadota bacterium]|uniref:flagellar motor switch protein FliN n=1 Tax=Pseudooceanicola nitratireducens TaxID=517719 RepID=UPI002ECA1C32|nr:flagellar motor switch protein FliN [Pseudomonadota bacterium]MEC9103988.1 flagellar motor switch protein FliN [Pseudomonadota bacterium]